MQTLLCPPGAGSQATLTGYRTVAGRASVFLRWTGERRGVSPPCLSRGADATPLPRRAYAAPLAGMPESTHARRDGRPGRTFLFPGGRETDLLNSRGGSDLAG